METNIETVDQDVERIRLKYGDKDIPQEELTKFKVTEFLYQFEFNVLLKSKLDDETDLKTIQDVILTYTIY